MKSLNVLTLTEKQKVSRHPARLTFHQLLVPGSPSETDEKNDKAEEDKHNNFGGFT